VAVVVDTNVAVVAERLHAGADTPCVDTCMDRLLDIMASGGLFLDDGDAIVEEYTGALGHAGQPGIGRAFVKWAFDHRFDHTRCRLVAITQCRDGGWRSYEEFPDDAALSTFDRNDQKFAAVAIASGANPPVLNAVDSDWWHHANALASAGVKVEFLCPQHQP
jgi:hypothetical protein